jgi:hypothetical protein
MGKTFYKNEGVRDLGKFKNDWYGSVKGFIMRYYAKGDESTEIRKKIIENCNIVLLETEQMEHGDDQIKAIKMVLIEKTHTVNGVALELHYGSRTVQRWVSRFIEQVGERSGF